MSEFRSTYSDAALKKMEALDRSIRALGIPGPSPFLMGGEESVTYAFVLDHPSVVGALQSFEHSLGQMRNMVRK